MKIACFVNYFPILSQTFILNQITGLLDLGHQVDIYANRIVRESVTHDDVNEYGLMNKAVCHTDFAPRMPLSKPKRIRDALILLKNNHREDKTLRKALNFIELGKPALSLQSLFTAAAFKGRGLEEYGIVHCHFGPNGNLGALLKYLGIIKGKVITTFYGYDISSYVARYGKEAYRMLFNYGDQVLCLSHKMKRELRHIGCPESIIRVHRLGVDMSRFTYCERGRRENGKVEIFTPARLVEKKGLEYGIEAIGRIVGAHPLIRYRIAGDGPLRDALEKLIESSGLSNHVELLGWRSQEEVIQLLKDSHIVLAPSVTAADGDQEGTPTVLIEALAQGLPVVSTHHSGIPEIVEDGRSGYLVPERDVDRLAEKLAHLIEHPELWPEMGRCGRAHVEEHYDINRLCSRLEGIYAGLSA